MATQGKGRKPTDAARRRTFLKALEEGAVVSRAAQAAEIATSTLYRWRQRYPKFGKDWATALDVALDELEGALVKRAIEGVAKPIVYGGKEVATVHQYSDALAMFLLRSKRPEIYDRERAVQKGEFVDDGDETADIIAERLRLSGAGVRSVSVAGSGIFTGSAAETRVKANALAGLIDDYELSFESGERMQGRFLVTRLDYAGDYNGERNYTLSLESSGPVVSL